MLKHEICVINSLNRTHPNQEVTIKYKEFLHALCESISKRDGEVATEELKVRVRPVVEEGLAREFVVQVIALEKPMKRIGLLLLAPGLIVPYLFRIRLGQLK